MPTRPLPRVLSGPAAPVASPSMRVPLAETARDCSGDSRATRRRYENARNAAVIYLPSKAGEVSASYADGGVMSISAGAHDPSVRFADTSPSRTPRRGEFLRAQHQPRHGAAQFQGTATARKRRVGHEIVVGDERFLADRRAAVGAVGGHDPALGVVLEVGDHDLVEHLL